MPDSTYRPDAAAPSGRSRPGADGPGALLLRYTELAARSAARSAARWATRERRRAAGTRPGAHAAGAEAALPDRVLERRVLPEADHLDRYSRVCGFDVADTLPPTYPHVLAFGDTLRLLAEPRFPFPAVGLVHVRLDLAVLRPVGRAEPLTLRSRLGAASAHRRGPQVDVVVEARDDAGAPVWRSASRYLHPERHSGPAAMHPGPADPTAWMRDAAPNAHWRLGGDLGRRYAAVSGDPNPIHLHPLTALLTGRRRPIAHGMWLAARCLAALADRLPDAYLARVEFRRPVRLPGELGFATRPADGPPGDAPVDDLPPAGDAPVGEYAGEGRDFRLTDLRAPGAPRVTGHVRGHVREHAAGARRGGRRGPRGAR